MTLAQPHTIFSNNPRILCGKCTLLQWGCQAKNIKSYGIRYNVVLDDKLVKDCIKATGIKTKKALIDHALCELLRHEKQIKILELKGKIDWNGNLDEWRQGRSL